MRASFSIFRAIVVAVALVLTAAVPASAQQLLGGYWAFIGQADLYNSNGVRLTEARQILRQDRANLHRFGIWQNGDQWDPFFGTYQARENMYNLLASGGMTAIARNILLQGGGSVYVYVYGFNGMPTSIVVTHQP